MIEGKEILTTKEAAAYLNIHLVTVYRLIKANKLPAIRIGGLWRFRRKSLDAFFKGGQHETVGS